MKYVLTFFATWLTVGAALATSADDAREAMALLDSATEQLEAAESSRDRVRALTATISAYEVGLGALRSGLRQVAIRQAELSEALRTHDGEIAALLAALQRVGGTGSPVVLLHPAGPVGTVRAGMLLADLAPALDAEAADLRRDLAELEDLGTLQKHALEQLEASLSEVQLARTALNQAIANRGDLPKRFILDPVNEAVLVASAQTLSEFALGLDLLIAEDVVQASFDIAARKGTLPAPAAGKLLHRAGERDAAGVARPGIILETAPRAIVTSPVPATIRYVGPLLDLGQVVILEPQSDLLFVLAGLGTVYGAAGDLIEADTPLGLMGDGTDKSAPEASTDGDEPSAEGTETLYIEVREKNTPVDPALWFRVDKDG